MGKFLSKPILIISIIKLWSALLPSSSIGNTIFSYTLKTGTKLYAWKTNPICLNEEIAQLARNIVHIEDGKIAESRWA